MTVDTFVRDKIDSVVADWVGNGRMFTAFEVSLAVKDLGVRQRHRDIKQDVHESIARLAGARYTRTLRDVGAPVQAWLYHGLGDDPYSYRPLPRSDGSPVSAPGPGGPVLRRPRPLGASDSSADPANNVCGTDTSGGLVIPARLLSQLGVGPDEKAYLTCDAANAELRIARASITTLSYTDVLVTNADGSLRVPPETLSKAELDGMQSYAVEGSGNAITVHESVGQ